MGHLHGPEAANEGGVSVNKDTLGNRLPAPEGSDCRSKHKSAAAAAAADAAAAARDTSLLLDFSLQDNTAKRMSSSQQQQQKEKKNKQKKPTIILLVNLTITTLYHFKLLSQEKTFFIKVPQWGNFQHFNSIVGGE